MHIKRSFVITILAVIAAGASGAIIGDKFGHAVGGCVFFGLFSLILAIISDTDNSNPDL